MTTANARDPAWAGGAVGDGIVNDTAAITAAITALPAGSTLQLGPGTFMVDTINVGKSLNIIGAGPGVTTLKNRGTNGQHLLWVRADNVTVSGMTIDGNRSIQTANTGSSMVVGETANEYKNFTLHNCEIKSNGFECISLVRVNGFRVTDNYIWDNWDTGCDILENARNGVVANNLFVSGGRYAIAFDAPTLAACSNIAIQDNVIRLPATGVPNVGGGTVAPLWGIVMLNVDGITVQGNTVDCTAGACFGGIRAQGQSPNAAVRVTIKDNVVRGGAAATDSGISIDGTVIQAMRAVIEGNVVTGFTGTNIAGISNTNAQKVTISGNNVSNCYYGINCVKNTGKNITELLVTENQVDGGTVPIRFGVGSGGTGVATVSDNHATGGSFANWAVDAGWTIYYSGPDRVSPSIDAAAVIIDPPRGTSSVTATAALALPNSPASSYVVVNGTTTVTSIPVGTSWAGRIVCLRFSGILTFTHGNNILLAGAANFTTANNSMLTLICDGTNFYEIARKA